MVVVVLVFALALCWFWLCPPTCCSDEIYNPETLEWGAIDAGGAMKNFGTRVCPTARGKPKRRLNVKECRMQALANGPCAGAGHSPR